MIIFGSRTSSKLAAALIFACVLCHATAAQRLFRVRTWFTLFFAPIFPFGHGKYVLQCSYCGQTQNLDRETADRFIADSEATRQRLEQHGRQEIPAHLIAQMRQAAADAPTAERIAAPPPAAPPAP